jgi:hypothetical protein
MRSTLLAVLVAAGSVIAAIAPTAVKADPQVLTVSEMDAVTAARRWGPGGWRGIISGNQQSNLANVYQNVTASAFCESHCSLSLSASAVAVVTQSNDFDVH